MTIIPESVQILLDQHQPAVDAWLSQQFFTRLVAQNPEHLLVRVQRMVDFQPLEQGCAGYYHTQGAGTKPRHGLERLVRALLVKYLFHWSLRETEAGLNDHLLVRWFVGYTLLEAVLDHSTLQRFEGWVRRHQPRLFFNTLLQQLDQAFPELREGAQIGDTYACQANAAHQGTTQLLRETARAVLGALAQGAPQVYTAVRQTWEAQLLLGSAEERPYYALKAAERQERQARSVRGAWDLQQRVQPYLEQLPQPWRAVVQTRLADLRKIITDEFEIRYDAAGHIEQVVEWDAKHKGRYRLISATDREATLRQHGQDRTLGYNISLAIHPSGVIRAIQAATGSQPDASGVPDLIRAQQAHQHLVVPKLIYDQAAGTGHTRAQVAQLNDGQTQLVAHIPPTADTGRFGPQDFQLQPDGELRCPAQQTSRTRSRADQRDAWIYTFRAKTCQDCPLRAQCHPHPEQPHGVRRVFLSDYQAHIRLAQQYNQTPSFRQEMRLRPRVERVIFMLTHYDGARRARARGLAAADFQAKMCATVRNLRTWLARLEPANPTPRRTALLSA